MTTEDTGFDAYVLFNALRTHFSSPSYDFFKYNGKMRLKKESFLHRKDKYSYYKLIRKYNLTELRSFFVSNFISRKIRYIGNMLDEEASDTYTEWLKRTQSLSYVFKNDLDVIFEYTPKELMKLDGSYPRLLSMAMKNEISIETLSILNANLKVFDIWDSKIDDDILWPEYKTKIEKYTPFIQIDMVKFKQVLVDKMKECWKQD